MGEKVKRKLKKEKLKSPVSIDKKKEEILPISHERQIGNC